MLRDGGGEGAVIFSRKRILPGRGRGGGSGGRTKQDMRFYFNLRSSFVFCLTFLSLLPYDCQRFVRILPECSPIGMQPLHPLTPLRLVRL